MPRLDKLDSIHVDINVELSHAEIIDNLMTDGSFVRFMFLALKQMCLDPGPYVTTKTIMAGLRQADDVKTMLQKKLDDEDDKA